MADFSQNRNTTFDKMAASPAAPAGLGAAAQRYGGKLQAWQQGDLREQPWVPTDMAQVTQQWYSGANPNGTENGWATPFYNAMMGQMEHAERAALKENRGSVFYKQFMGGPEATGVMLWDDDARGWKAGDIIIKGVNQGEDQNVYKVFGQETGDLMMGSFYFGAAENKRLFAKRDPEAYRQAVHEKKMEHTQSFLHSESAEDYQKQVHDKALELRKGAGDDALVAAAGGGGLLATLGLIGTATAAGTAMGIWTGPGAAVTGTLAGLGVAVGLAGGWLNKDELTEMLARAQVRGEQVESDFDGLSEGAARGHQIKEYGALGMKLISPHSNVVRGAADMRYGSHDDSTVDWYGLDEEGNRLVPGWVRGLDFAATAVDSVGQFGSKAGVRAYMATMGTTTGGGTLALGSQGTYNDSTGKFDRYESAGEWASGAGSVLIDAAQMGMARGMGRIARQEQAYAAGKTLNYEASKVNKFFRQDYDSRFQQWLRRNDDTVAMGGTRFTLKDGKAVDHKWTFDRVVPSELAKGITTGARARQIARREGRAGQMSSDDLYRAALEFSGGSRWKSALVNAYAEGIEEGVQAVLDPWSVSDGLDGYTILESAMYGAASGVGMGLGSTNRTPSKAEMQDRLARMQFELREGFAPTDKQWKQIKGSMSQRDMDMLMLRTPEEDAAYQMAQEVIADGAVRDQVRNSAVANEGIARVKEESLEQSLKRANAHGGNALALFGATHESMTVDGVSEKMKFDGDTAAMSFHQVITSLTDKADAIRESAEFYSDEIVSLEKKVDELTTKLKDPNLSAEQKKAAQTDLDDANRLLAQKRDFLADIQKTIEAVQLLVGDDQTTGELVQLYKDFSNLSKPDERAKAIEAFNKRVADIYRGSGQVVGAGGQLIDADAARQVVEFLLPRHPTQDRGSFNIMLPQVSKILTEKNAHRAVFVHQSILKPLGGDHDGDNVVQQFDLYAPPEVRRNLRRGHQYFQFKQVAAKTLVDKDGNMLTEPVEAGRYVVNIDPPNDEAAYVEMVSDPSNDTEITKRIVDGFAEFKAQFLDRYVTNGPLERAQVEPLVDEYIAGTRAGHRGARTVFIEAVWNLNPEALFSMADVNGQPEVLAMWMMVSTTLEKIQNQIGMHRFVTEEVPSDAPEAPRRAMEKARLDTRARLQAVTYGLTLGMFGGYTAPRPQQQLHYSPLLQAALDWTVSRRTETMQRKNTSAERYIAELYELLGSGRTESDAEMIENENSIEDYVIDTLMRITRQMADEAQMNVDPQRLLLTVASMRVGDMQLDENGKAVFGKQDITLLQLLLRRGIQIQENVHRGLDPQSAKAKKLNKLRGLTSSESEHSSTAAQALVEVFGNWQLTDLLGQDALHLGSNLTLKQYQKLLLSKHTTQARRILGDIKNRVPAYFKNPDRGDPPVPRYYLYELMANPEGRGDEAIPSVNSFTLLIDALQTSTAQERKNRENQAKEHQGEIVKGIRRFQDQLRKWRVIYSHELSGTSMADVYEHMLERNPEVAAEIVKMIPASARPFVFQLQNGDATVAAFVKQVLTYSEQDLEKAAAILYLQVKMAEWNVMMSTPMNPEALAKFDEAKGEWVVPDLSELSREQLLGKVDPSMIKSRFLETMYYLATLGDGGLEYARFIKTVYEAESLTAIFDAINKEPVWLFGRAELHPYNDSVDDYTLSPDDVFSVGSADQQQRDAVREFSSAMDFHAKALDEAHDVAEFNVTTLAGMRTQNELEKNPNAPRAVKDADTTYSTLLDLLDEAIENVKLYGDIVGPNARVMAMEAFHEMILRLHDKGTSDARIEPMGTVLATIDSIGFGSAMQLEMNAVHSHDWLDAVQSPSMWAKGPIRIMLADGSILQVDLSTRDGALEALSDPATQAFAMAVLLPITRDVSASGAAQMYQNSNFASGAGKPGDIAFMLHEAANFTSLFNQKDGAELEQAWNLIGFVEAHIRKSAVEEQLQGEAAAAAHYPIQRMINEILEAYQTSAGTGRSERQMKSLHRELVIQVADALKMIGQLSDRDLLPRVKQKLAAVMQQRVHGDPAGINKLLESIKDSEDREAQVTLLKEVVLDQYEHEAATAWTELKEARAEGDPLRIALAEQDHAEKESRLADFKLSGHDLGTIGGLVKMDWDSAYRTFAMSHDPKDKEGDTARKAAIVAFLSDGARVNKFEGTKMAFELKGKYGEQTFAALLDRFREMAALKNGGLEDIGDWDPLHPEEWDQLALWSTSVFMEERAGRSSSDVKAAPVTMDNVHQFSRLHDDTWTFLLDALFTDQTYNAIRDLSARAGNTGFIDKRKSPSSTSKIAERLASTLLNEKKVTKWNSRVPLNILTMHLAMTQSGVGVDIARGGNYPKDFGPWIGTTQPTDKQPKAEHFSEELISVERDETLIQHMTGRRYVKLHHHYVSHVEIVSKSDPSHKVDLTKTVAGEDTSIPTPSGAQGLFSPLRVLDTTTLMRHVDHTLANDPLFADGMDIRIRYVDVDKKPPSSESEWVNNKYFDGRGRDVPGRTEITLLGSLLYGLNGESKLIQQGPLNVLTKAGKTSAPWDQAALAAVEKMETGSFDEVMVAKAWYLLTQAYPLSEITLDDLPAFYQYVKSRHVVVGRNKQTGKKEVWWVEDYISAEQSGHKPDLVNLHDDARAPELISLSESIAGKLLGGTGYDAYDPQRPQMNVQDMKQNPQLDEARLKELGLHRLGEYATLKQAPVSAFTALPRAYQRTKDNKEPFARSERELDLEAAVHRSVDEMTRRQSAPNTGKEGWSSRRASKKAKKIIRDLLDNEKQLRDFQKHGLIPTGSTDLLELNRSYKSLQRLESRATDNTMFWVFNIALDDNDMPNGVLGRLGLDGMYDKAVGRPVFGDTVAIDLASIWDWNGRDTAKAIDQAIEIVDKFAKVGVQIVLGSSGSNTDLRRAVSEHLTRGPTPVRYRRMFNASGHFFEPVYQQRELDATIDALESTMVAVDQEAAKNISVAFLPKRSMGNNEGVRFTTRAFDEVVRRLALQLVPTNMMLGVSSDHTLAFGLPVMETGPQDDDFKRISAELVAHYKTPEGEKELMKLMGSYPSSVPFYKKLKKGNYEPGVRHPKEAMKKFIETLEANKHPLQPGNEVMAGDIYMLVGSDGSILLHRIGFALPKETDKRKLLAQWQKPLGGARDGLRVAMADPKPDPNMSQLPPFTIDEATPDHRGHMLHGKYELGWAKKIISQGLKTTTVPLPEELRFATGLSVYDDNGTEIGSVVGMPDTVSKAATRGVVSNFRDFFALVGWDAWDDMVNALVPDDGRSFQERRDELETYLTDYAARNNDLSPTEAAKILSTSNSTLEQIMKLNDKGRSELGTLWHDLAPVTPTTGAGGQLVTDDMWRLVHIIMVTLATSGVTVDQVMSMPGVLTNSNPRTSDNMVGWMPEVMTAAMDSIYYPGLKKKLIDRGNAVLPDYVDEQGVTHRGSWFDETFTFYTTMLTTSGHGKNRVTVPKIVEGYLQIETPLPADENTINNQFNIVDKRDSSMHLARVAAGQGLYTFSRRPKRDKNQRTIPTPIDIYYGDNGFEQFENGRAAVWDFLNSVAPRPTGYYPAKYQTPLEHTHWVKGDEKVGAYTWRIPRPPKDDADEWPDNGKAREILKALKLHPVDDLVEIDYLVRQWYGAPRPEAGTAEVDPISHEMYVEATTAILENVKKGMNPLEGGDVPLPHHKFWLKVFKANQKVPEPWTPMGRVIRKDKREKVKRDDWAGWVNALMGQVRTSHAPFHAMFRVDLDGFYHTYQGTIASFQDIPMSMDEKISAKLMDPATQQALMSLDPGLAALMHEPALLETMEATWEAMTGHKPTYKSGEAADIPESSRAERNAQRKKWLEKNKLGKQKEAKMIDYVKTGVEYQESQVNNNRFLRGVIHLSIATRLLNPGLYTSAFFEVHMRNALANTTDLLLGESTGRAGQILGKGISKAEQTRLAGLLGDGSIQPKYTPDQIAALRRIAGQIGADPKWRAALFGEVTYQTGLLPGQVTDEDGNPIEQGKWANRLERLGTQAARVMNDPTLGMRQSSAALRYVNGALEYLTMTNNVISIDTLLQELEKNPLYLKEQFSGKEFNPHKAGVNAVSQVRSTKGTMLGHAIMKPVDKLVAADTFGKAALGVTIKLPFMFTRFAANAMLTLTGLSSADQAMALMLDGRAKPTSWLRNRRDPNQPIEVQNYSDVIETFDLQKMIVRSGISQTGLLVAGLAGANLLGLSGEDEEERRRRRMQRYLNIPMFYDPKKAHNDFLYADAIWLDDVPFLGNFFVRKFGDEERSAVIPHWMFRQWTSPMMGVVRFLDTGDFRNVTHGFADAASVIPNSVMYHYRDWTQQASLINSDLEQLEAQGIDPNEAQARGMWMLAAAVGTLEKTLIENQFINSMYTALDDVDRNPYAMPLVENGQIAREDGTLYPLPTALLEQKPNEPLLDPVTGEPILNPETGEPYPQSSRLAYAKRTGMDAILHQHSENNLTAATLLSLLTGQGLQGTYNRNEMVPKKQLVPIKEASKEEAEALVLAAFFGRGGQEVFTKEEIIRGLKFQAESTNTWWHQDQIEARAETLYKVYNDPSFALSFVDKNSQEALTKAGADSVLAGLMSGSITLDHPAMQGMSIPYEMRVEIAQEWLDENVQESINNGLSVESAEYRKRRFWFGDSSTGKPGLRDILFSEKIPYSAVSEYNQLNVTFAIGPDGRPWATPFTRQTALGAIGIPMPHSVKPLADGTSLDTRGNVVNNMTGVNTGLKAVTPAPQEAPEVDMEEVDKILDKVKANRKTPTWSNRWGRSYGRGGYYRRGGYGGRGGGGGGGGGYVSPMFTDKILRNIRAGYGPQMQGVYAPNADNPLLRRADVRRERVTSERGRLKQWQ